MTTKDIEKQIRTLAAKKGMDVKPVFVDFLDYIIGYFSPEGKPIEGWASKYTKEDNDCFFQMMRDYFTLMDEELSASGWYDAFGDLFMSLNTRGNDKGQFFTPQSLCEVMAQTAIDEKGDEPFATHKTPFGKRVTINDCAAGSSRSLLAAHSIFMKKGWRKPYLIAEDLDATCCKMSAINMMVHGCFGEVVQHDTLMNPDKANFGYVINETMYPFPTNVPSIRYCGGEKSFLATRVWKARENATERKKMPSTAKIENTIPVQLNLF